MVKKRGKGQSPDSTVANVPEPAEEKEKILMSTLLNSGWYFLHPVYIFNIKGSYNLLVLHNGKLRTLDKYLSGKGAKIAFIKLWHYKSIRDNISPQWSHFYKPDSDWLEEKLSDPLLASLREQKNARRDN